MSELLRFEQLIDKFFKENSKEQIHAILKKYDDMDFDGVVLKDYLNFIKNKLDFYNYIMETKGQTKDYIEEQFQKMLIKAKELYPDIGIAISTLENVAAQTVTLQDYLNLTYQTPSEICNNQTTF
jgi:hypothetical protein